ncbi:LysR substrate-binding domain-containing protein [Bdellovibrio svalbardensis]|uniref:LysR family transcriptional regulator n=1 Tax=Bdellovibrio svalbardensis TaxID=2972972 RepID=A0ABT6DMZ3_9BACT|nr:LysR family transcriptional regulator [Bdellovibrio svalbardensis]MDG0817294.1 LysR family transcriptional regulator [Bdellovibrio svalbardensis]
MMDKRLTKISFFDLSLLAELPEHKSLRSLARSLDIEPPRLTKVLQSVRHQLQFEIIKTSSHGYILTAEGSYVSHQAKELLKKSEDFIPRKSQFLAPPAIYTVGGRGFMNVFFAGAMIESLEAAGAKALLRFMDLSPEELRQTATEGVLDVALHLEEIKWPQTWAAAEVGSMSWDLYVGKNHPLKGTISTDELLKYPFARSAYWNGRAIAQATDNLPIPRNERIMGHEMQTALTAVEIVQHSNNVALIPNIIAKKYEAAGFIRNLKVRGLELTEAKIYLSVRSDKISQRLFKQWQTQLKSLLKDT